MPRLTKKLLEGSFRFPPEMDLPAYPDNLPERVIQFGEGNFLRAFVDWMFHRLNNSGQWGGRVVVVQPIADGLAGRLNEQDGLYTLALRGLQDGRPTEELSLIGVVSRALNAYSQWEEVLKCAENPTIEYLISNTTEAGISHDPADGPDLAPPASFPGKVTAYLYRRFRHFGGDAGKGMTVIPCELIDRNGDVLKKVVLRYAAEWKLPKEFAAWVEKNNLFLNTLVDRVVTGYPRDEAAVFAKRLGYEDGLLDTGENFHLWVIEGPARLAEKLPFTRIGLNVIWTDDMTPYRTRKVRILNGAHTASVPAAFLYGLDTVGEMMDDGITGRFVREAVYEEIIPACGLDKDMLKSFADAVVERFRNPFIKHYLLSILLNSASKFKNRVLPSILDHQRRLGRLPRRLVFGLAALAAVYRDGRINGAVLEARRAKGPFEMRDDLPVLEAMAAAWQLYDGTGAGARAVTAAVLANTALWGQDLNKVDGLTDLAAGYLHGICRDGMAAALAAVLDG
ncbi:tagaturonate reductase [Anaeroselena agilis]|uniref:Tagaturonate reductase n=1 Tax=Anaeroselena agilis TaxID=3063788 RepID=A0ABU3P6C3_9FIRM|nr:tagaturonate reductase [Selenomonadales bacterium 4137-cl]